MGKDKYLFKNWEENDVFAWKINCSDDNIIDQFKIGPELENFQGKYLLFIYTKKQQLEHSQTNKSRQKLFRVKITPTSEIPKTLEDINNCEYLVTGGTSWIDRFYSLPRDILIKEYKNPTIFPDKYGCISQYFIYFLSLTQQKVKENWIYLGNFDINLPKDEYLPVDENGNEIIFPLVQCSLFKNIQHYLLYHHVNREKRRQKSTDNEIKKMFLWQSGAIYGALHFFGLEEYGLSDKEWMRIIMTIPKSNNPDHLHLPSYDEMIGTLLKDD